ncbi:MAG TPA: hypothetical protein PLQ76_06915, partial [bacterium]|nr:hypothetical protein [bacterium]
MTLENQKRNYTSLIENSFYEFSMQFAALKKAELYKGPDVRWVYTGFPGFNRIFDAKFDEKTVDARIEEVLEKFKTAKQSALWFIGPTSTPADLGKRLLNHGVIHIDDWSGMALDLTKHEIDTKLPRGMTVEEATDEEGLKLWGQVVSRAFLVPKFSADQFVQVFAELGTGGR